MKFLALITVFFIVLAHPVIARHHTKVQGEPSKSEQSYKNATRAYRVGDYATTLMYLRPLAEQNHKKAQGTLGWMYEAGKGVRRDYIMAFVWYDLAVTNGHKKAGRNRNSVKSKLDENELKKARALSQKCLEEPTGCPKYSD
jgi:TPR repeat protein